MPQHRGTIDPMLNTNEETTEYYNISSRGTKRRGRNYLVVLLLLLGCLLHPPWGGSAGRYCGITAADMLVLAEIFFPCHPFPFFAPFPPLALPFLSIFITRGVIEAIVSVWTLPS